ncbi:MAG: hypothetical protein FWG68_10700 [Defluviitaleaceae bacterium]|nr:hypothetical protein [Defluviitaleaceae bacterium]
MGFLQRIRRIFGGNGGESGEILVNAKKLKNIQAMAYYIACEEFDDRLYPCFTAIDRDSKCYDKHDIFYLSKLFANQIIFNDIEKTLVDNEHTDNGYIKRFFDFSSEKSHIWRDLDKKFYQPFSTEQPLILNLKDTPTISNVWPARPTGGQKSRLARGIAEIGTPKSQWKEQDGEKHKASLFLPMGLLVVTESGNHSIATGVLKSSGNIRIGGDTRRKIYDMSELYTFMYFDGVFYRKKADNSIICGTKSFEFGAIFEIGRIVHEYDISFVDFCGRQE